MQNQRDSSLAHAAALLIAFLLAAVAASALAQPRAVTLPAAVPGGPKKPAADDLEDEKDPSELYFPGGAALKTDPEQQRLLKRAEQCVEDGRLDLAAVLWQKVLDEAGDTLMVSRVQPKAIPGSETKRLMYTSLSEEVERTLARLPPLALQTYRVSADGEAQAILAAAGAGQEEEALATVVRRYFLSSHGDDAAYELACLALDRHDFVGASRLLSRILERHPDPSIPASELWLRMAVASARMGDKASADQALLRLAAAPGIRPASETVSLVRDDVARATALASAALGPASRDWHMQLGLPSRTGHMTALPSEATGRTLSELWVQEWPLASTGENALNPYTGMFGGGGVVVFSGRIVGQQNQPSPISREELVAAWRQNGWMPTAQLLFDGGRVYLKTPDRLVAFSASALSDQPAWKSLWRNQYQLDGMSQMTAMMSAQMFGGNLPQGTKPKTTAEVLLFGDRVHQSMTISGGVVYSLEGKAISETSPQQPAPPNRGWQWGVTPRRTRKNWLTAYSAVGGKVKWTRTASDEDKDGTTDIGFLAAPVACGNILLAPVTDGGTIWLHGLAAEDGRTLWKSYLCDEPQGGANPWSPITIAVEGREAYLTVGCGVIFAVDAVGGSIRWAMRYTRDGKPNAMMRQMGHQPGSGLMDPSGWDDDLVIPYGRALVVMSSDCDKLLSLDRRSGELLWESPRVSPFGAASSYCVGVNGRGLIVAGKNIVRRYDIPSGRLVWEKEIEDSLGRGCVTGDAVYIPVKDSILKLEVEKGRELIQVGVALTTDDPVGNLFSDGEKIWVASAGRVYAMTTLEHRMESLARQIAAGDADAQLNRMRLYFKQKQLNLALADLRGAYALYQRQLPPDESAARLFAAIIELKLPQTQPLIALQVLTEAFASAPSLPALAKESISRRSDLIGTSVNTIRQKKLPGGAAAVLTAAPLVEDDYLITAATYAIDLSAGPADVTVLKEALASGRTSSQLMAIRTLARLAPEDARPELKKLQAGGDDRLRLASARALANLGERDVLDTLVALLESGLPRVRARSHQTLRALTGQQINFTPEGKPEDRAKTVTAWKDWLAANSTAKLVLPLTEQNVPLGRTLYVSQGQSLLIELDSDRKKRWETKLPGPAWGCQGLPNGHRLVAVYAQSLVVEYNEEGKEVWRKEGLPGPPYSVQRLENGNTLVACADIQQIVEIAPDGTFTSINVQGRPMSAQRLDNGNTLVALQQGNRVVEVDRTGKITWEARTGNGPSHAVRLENGNTLVSLMYTRQVAEYDPTGKNIVWRSKVQLANPYCAQRLPGGSTLVSDHLGLREINEAGDKAIWEQRQQGITGMSNF
ncbi:MAG: PQQ-binding-like beta-propeller repeat protein [Pirellulaceae bacterium]|nr:PQQ-binding-like beta-propeller repeat protein [Pirellulaceae bacterium]